MLSPARSPFSFTPIFAAGAVALERLHRARLQAVLFGRNYGQAGALDFYGRELGLSPVVSLAGSFDNFGPGERAGEVIVLLGVELADLESGFCGSLELVDRVVNPWGVPEERDVPILVCRNPSMTLQEFWECEGRPHRG